MRQLYKFSSNYFFSGVSVAVILFTLTSRTGFNRLPSIDFRVPLTAANDTIIRPRVLDTLGKKILPAISKPNEPSDTVPPTIADSLPTTQRIDSFSLRISKDSLEAPLRYAAKDSAVVLIKEEKILLYGKTRTEYKDMILTAPRVEVDQKTQIITAFNKKDSLGDIVERAVFKTADNELTMDTIWYNFKTQKGLTRNTFTQEGEIFVQTELAKKVDDNTTFMKRARFTTCNLDDPHFAFLTGKMKVVNKKLAVSGPAHPEFEGVPVPIYLPFGIYPLSQGRHSGLLPPQFTTNEQYGIGLEGLGYYKVLNDYWDTKLYGNIYSYGSWSANLNPTYRKRYRYSGAFNLSVQSTKINFKGDPDFTQNRSYFIAWNHSVDSRARPGTNFSASVNAGSTKFYQLVPNSTHTNFQNQLGSSIAYSKTWAGKPYNLTLSANHNQNNFTRLINVSLPDAGFSVSTIYPFQKEDYIGSPKWYQKLGIGYNGTFRNSFAFYDTAFKFKDLIDTLQLGGLHNFPLTVALPPILNGAVIVSPSISYSQIWIAQKVRKKWNPIAQKLDTTVTKGFFTDHQLQFSIGLNTAIFGTYQFKKSRIMAVRHVIRPSLSFNYRPDLSKGHFYKEQVDATGTYILPFSEFEGSLFGYYPEGQVGGLGFQLDNNLEMKWRSRKDTGENAIKKIRLIDGYGLSTGYNFLRDSMKLDLMNLYFRTNLFEKISITADAIFDPYEVDERGRDIDKLSISSGKFKLGRISSGRVSISTNFQSKPKDPQKEEQRKKIQEQQLDDANLIADRNRLLDYMRQNPSEFVDFNIPWRVGLSYSLFFREVFTEDFSKFKKEFSSNVSFDGSFNLTPKWNFNLNGYFDFDTKKLQTFQLAIAREMHCWQMSISVTPVGLYRSFSFSISPKASVLQDLKINRTRSFYTF